MDIFKINDMVAGWFIGDFAPSVMRTKDFEVGIKIHNAGEKWPSHFHRLALEINYLVDGKIQFGDKIIEKGDIFVFKPLEVSTPIFLETCTVVCVKVPSLPKDKVLV